MNTRPAAHALHTLFCDNSFSTAVLQLTCHQLGAMKEDSVPLAYSTLMGFSTAVTRLTQGTEFLVGADRSLRQRRESPMEEHLTTYPNTAKHLPSAVFLCDGTPVSAVKPRHRRASWPLSGQPVFRARQYRKTETDPEEEMFRQIRKASPVGSPILPEAGGNNFEPDMQRASSIDEASTTTDFNKDLSPESRDKIIELCRKKMEHGGHNFEGRNARAIEPEEDIIERGV